MTGNHIILTNLSGYEAAVDSIDMFCRKVELGNLLVTR